MDEFRDKVQDFDAWADSLAVRDPEDRVQISKAAERLLQNQVLLRIFAELERNALFEIRQIPLNDTERLIEAKAKLFGVVATRKAFRKIAEENILEERRKRLQGKQ